MEKNKENNTTICPLCGSFCYKELDYGGYEYRGIEMPLVQCGNCSLSYIVHNLSPEDIREFYNDISYFDSEYAGGVSKKYTESIDEQEKKLVNVLNIFEKYKNGNKLLEVGSAGGIMLNLAKNKYGIEVYGVEVSKEMCDFAIGKGLNICHGTIDSIPKDWKGFDIVYMGDVLEHIPNPNEFISTINEKLKDKGLLVLELPLTYNLTLSGIFIGILNIIKGKWGYKYFLPSQHRVRFIKKPPYHLIMFNKKSIYRFFNENGFKIIYLKEYEGVPKEKFTGYYKLLKNISSFLTSSIYQSFLGDRMIVVGRKID